VTKARDRLQLEEPLAIENSTVRCQVLAGGLRIVELE
jgi:hypothetical protein